MEHHGNKGKELLGTSIFLLVINGSRGPNTWTTRIGLEHGDDPRSAPDVGIKSGGLGVVARHRRSDDETDRYTPAECRNVEHWADALVVQSRVDSKGDGNVDPPSHASGGSPPTGVTPHRQVVHLTNVPDYDVWMEEEHETKGPLRDR
jgi:hypothetical protein